MKRKDRFKALLLAVTAGMLASGCGKSALNGSSEATVETAMAYDTAAGYMSNDIYSNAMPAEEAKAVEDGGSYDEGTGEMAVQDTRRKLIKNVDLQVETETFDELLATVEDKTRQAGGYIEQSYTYNGSNYYGGGTRNASLTIRIPAQNLDGFLSAVAEVSNVITRNESVSDVTLQYVDLESHKKALQAEQGRLLELLERAETIEDIITLESRLSDVRYQIESMESQLRTMDNQVSYSTVELYINEVEKLTPVKEQTAWQKISTGFAASMHNVGNGLANFGIGLIISLPYLILWAVILSVIILITCLMVRRSKKKKQKMQQAIQQDMEQNTRQKE